RRAGVGTEEGHHQRPAHQGAVHQLHPGANAGPGWTDGNGWWRSEWTWRPPGRGRLPSGWLQPGRQQRGRWYAWAEPAPGQRDGWRWNGRRRVRNRPVTEYNRSLAASLWRARPSRSPEARG